MLSVIMIVKLFIWLLRIRRIRCCVRKKQWQQDIISNLVMVDFYMCADHLNFSEINLLLNIPNSKVAAQLGANVNIDFS